MPDFLNAKMAAALAPVLGEGAVYAETVYVCANGHVNTRCTPNYEWGDECIECDGGAWTDDSIKVPIDFADPAVGLPLWDKWAAEMLPDVEITYFADHVLVDLHTTRTTKTTSAATLWRALLVALAEVLGVLGEEVSGDA